MHVTIYCCSSYNINRLNFVRQWLLDSRLRVFRTFLILMRDASILQLKPRRASLDSIKGKVFYLLQTTGSDFRSPVARTHSSEGMISCSHSNVINIEDISGLINLAKINLSFASSSNSVSKIELIISRKHNSRLLRARCRRCWPKASRVATILKPRYTYMVGCCVEVYVTTSECICQLGPHLTSVGWSDDASSHWDEWLSQIWTTKQIVLNVQSSCLTRSSQFSRTNRALLEEMKTNLMKMIRTGTFLCRFHNNDKAPKPILWNHGRENSSLLCGKLFW